MNYQETIEYLFNVTPLFQNVGKDAYKEGLQNTLTLDEHFCHPHTKFKTIHVAGTNGKGSCSHTIAAILQSSGLKVGLFTSPHLIDFRERIRVNGEMISEEYVVNFVADNREFFEPLYPSFFELTTAMAFKYFAEQEVDVAVIEVGLGGRLDCTNIISPEACIITNISFDHVALLGNTLAKIASEKAGIIKHNVPVVIGEANDETRPVFQQKAEEVNTEIVFADDEKEIIDYHFNELGGICYETKCYGTINAQLGGYCQTKNTNTILHALALLKQQGFSISDDDVRNGFEHVCELTGLMGRWQTIQTAPTVITDTGHNIGGFEWITQQLNMHKAKLPAGNSMRIVFGMVNDKDISGVLNLMPKDATYYFTQASVKRALPHEEIEQIAKGYGLEGTSFASVGEAYEKALADSDADDFVYVGGSSFIVADLLRYLNEK